MSMPETKHVSHKPADKADDKAPVEAAPVQDAPVVEETAPAEPQEPVVHIAISPDYSGPEPVFISTEGHDRVEIDKTGTAVPVADLDNFVALPFVEVVD